MRSIWMPLLAAGMAIGQALGPADGRGLPPTDLNRIKVGQPAPDFVLPTGDGRTLALSGFRGKNLVLVFYRGHW